MEHHVSQYGRGPTDSPQDSEILVDTDGEWFLNYLDAARLDEDSDLLPLYQPEVARHRDSVVNQLEATRANLRAHQKHQWTAGYHNYVCGYQYPGDKRFWLLVWLRASSVG
ncbi:MAG: hypothetical protein JWN04_3463 [Myxococcaceae bacterium]|nr:hypothetical protein [Myxococcaceae bacterium]